MPFHEDHENIMLKGKDPKHRNATSTFFSKKTLAIQGDDRLDARRKIHPSWTILPVKVDWNCP